MSDNQQTITAPGWSSYEVLALKFFSIFFLALIVPLDYKFYVYLFSGNWLDFHVTDIVKIVSYLPSFFNEADSERHLGFDGFASWGIALVLSAVGVFIWNSLETNKLKWLSNYDCVYYWIRVILRYKVALVLIAYGSLKAFSLQFPFPSLSNLHTNYGDFLPWKIWAHTVGVTPNYEAFLGGAEILAGLLLLIRGTATFGAALALGILTNVVFSSFSYQMGNQVISTFVFVASLFIFAHDGIRLFSLFILEKRTKPESFVPAFSSNASIVTRGLASVVALSIFLSAWFNTNEDPYLTPKAKALESSYGYYNVREFVLNGDTIPYSRTDRNRWQNVVFEKWATISIKTAEPVKVDKRLYLTSSFSDIDRVYESAGVGDRRYFKYTVDSAAQSLHLQNKNANYRAEKYSLKFSRPAEGIIVLEGLNDRKQTIKAVLEKIDKKYMLIEGRRSPIQL